MLSVILPSFNEEDNILNTAKVLKDLLEENGIDYELLFIDDGSRDKTWERICQASDENPSVKGVRFSKNFGKESAIFAGLENASGDACLVMDCDLQHPPQTILEMYELWQSGIQVVEGKKSSRGKENPIYGALSNLFNAIIKKASGIDMLDASDFKLLDRVAVDAVLNMPERVTFFRAMSSWVGFEKKTVYFDVAPRLYGDRKWSIKGLFKYAFNSIMSYTNVPLVLAVFLGTLICMSSAVLIILSLCGVELGSFTPAVSVCMLIGGMILIFIGITGYYVLRIFDEVRNRPRYIVAKTVGGKNDR